MLKEYEDNNFFHNSEGDEEIVYYERMTSFIIMKVISFIFDKLWNFRNNLELVHSGETEKIHVNDLRLYLSILTTLFTEESNDISDVNELKNQFENDHPKVLNKR